MNSWLKNRQIFISGNWIKKNQKEITSWLQKNNNSFLYHNFEFEIFKNNLIINNYFYLLRKNNFTEQQLFFKILMLYLITNLYFVSNFRCQEKKILQSLSQLINKLFLTKIIKLQFINNYEHHLKVIKDKIYQQKFMIHDYANIIGNIYAQSFDINNQSIKQSYYDYGYYLTLLWHLAYLKNNNLINQIWLYQSKLLVSYQCDETIKKMSPFIFNYFIIENNRMLKFLKGKSWN